MSRRRYFQPVLRAVSQAFGLFIGGFDNRKILLFQSIICEFHDKFSPTSEYISKPDVCTPALSFVLRFASRFSENAQLSSRTLRTNLYCVHTRSKHDKSDRE